MSEYELHRQVVDYIKIQYPKVVFRSDMAGIRLHIGSATKNKRLQIQDEDDKSLKFPDLEIYHTNGFFNGFLLEIKTEDKSPYKKNGELKSNKHTIKQSKMIDFLGEQGYYASFGVGFDNCKRKIDDYLKL